MTDALDLTSTDEERILQTYFNNTTVQFQIISCKVTEFSAQRAGYLGDHFLLSFEVKVAEADINGQEVKLFVKSLPKAIPSLARYLEETKAFRKEAEFVKQLIPRLSEFGRFAPEALFEKDHKLIVFRNVKLEGFRTLEHNDGLLDLVHLEQALRVLARLHASSFALEAQQGKSVVELFPGVLDENAWVLRENYPRVAELEADINALCALIKHSEKNNDLKMKLVERMPDCIREIYELVKSSNKYKNAVSHSDLWNNNLMFRYSDSGAPVDCLLVDFQLARYVPPAYDFNMLLTLTTTSGFRRMHFNFLQGYYFQSLRMELTRHQLEIDNIVSQNEFLESCQHYRKAGAIDSFIISHVTLLPKSFLDEIFSCAERYEQFSGDAKIERCLQAFDEDLNYRTRMIDVIQNLADIFDLH